MNLFAKNSVRALPIAVVALFTVHFAHAQIGVRGWPSYAGDAQHTGQSHVAGNNLYRIRWQTPVDLNPQYHNNDLLIHYGSPLVTAANTVIVTVKTGASGGFRVDGRDGVTGASLYQEPTDYVLPSSSWTPSCGSTLTPDNRLVTPANGGTVLIRANADDPSSTVTRIAFFGNAVYNGNPGAYNSSIKIDTPITSDAAGNIYFGFIATSNPSNLVSGLARISSSGVGTWTSAATLANDSNAAKIPINCAPAISNDGASVYVGTNGGGNYLVKANSATLAPISRVLLIDPKSGSVASPNDQGTASPMVGPDNDVYYGVLENPFASNRDRGWMLHFDSTLASQKPTGAFGWDNTASVVPASMVPSYGGSSPYLILTKYNDYLGFGPGDNKVAILDPNATMNDPISGIPVMSEVLTLLGPTVDPAGGVREWCINTAAVDPFTRSAYVSSEDGNSYRWDLTTNTLTQTMNLTVGIGEAYTPTCVGPDGTVYAINNGILFALSDNTVLPTSYSLSHGISVGGNLTSLLYSDDNRLLLNPGPVANQSIAPIEVLINTSSFTATATSMGIRLESQGNSANIRQETALMNFATGNFEVVDTRLVSLTDTVVQISVSGDPTRFINPATHAVQARVTFRTAGPVLSSRWFAKVDQFAWTINP